MRGSGASSNGMTPSSALNAVIRAWEGLTGREREHVPEALREALLRLFTERYYLGGLCKHGHKYNGMDLSLRYKSTHGCVACVRAHSKAAR